MKLLLGRFQSGFTLDNLSRFLQGDQSDGIVLRVEQAIELRAAILCCFCPNSTHAKDLGVGFRFVLNKQLVDVNPHVIFR